MKRGDVILCVMSNDLGKVRPAVIVQSDLFNGIRDTTTVCPLTSTCIEAPLFRVTIEPNAENGIQKMSQIMVDKICSIKNSRIREVIGSLSITEIDILDNALRHWLALEILE
jgi:mRNA interferase MazF